MQTSHVLAIVSFLLFVIIIFLTVEINYIPSVSMEDTLIKGDTC